MRLTSRVVPVVVLGSALGIGACAAPKPLLDVRATEAVTITTACWDKTVSFELTPWEVDVQRGDQVDWTMAPPPRGAVGEYQLVPESPGDWPYPDMLGKSGKGKGKAVGRPNLPLRSNQMHGGTKSDTRHKYTIEYWCHPEGGTDSLQVIIDPDVVVDRAAQ